MTQKFAEFFVLFPTNQKSSLGGSHPKSLVEICVDRSDYGLRPTS